jgi:hypothetical protein
LLSENLPLGYGYTLHPPEGVDPEAEKVNLQTYRKKSGVVPTWNEPKSGKGEGAETR